MAKRLKPKPGDTPETIRYGAPTADRTLTLGDAKSMKAIEKHITKHLGKPKFVYHEIYSELVHIDVHVVPPTKKRPFWYLITTGMSDRAMRAPKEAKDFRFAELAIALPGWWKLDERSLKSQRWYWPILWLKTLARFPHEFETWLFFEHSVPLADDFPAPGTKFEGVVMEMDDSFPPEFFTLKVGKRTIYFLSPVPVYPEEMQLKLSEGAEALNERLVKLGTFDNYDPKRPNSCAKPTRRPKSMTPAMAKGRKN